jgi:type I restriction enzyme S subunit
MAWPKVRLGDVLTHRKEFVTIDDLQTYKRPRVQLHAQGIVLRDEVPGALIKTKKQQVCREGEFLVAEIDAKVGGFGIVPSSLGGSIVSSHYFLFVVDESKLDRQFLDFFVRTPAFREQVAAQGSTNYAAIRPAHVLAYEIPLPLLAEQRRIVAHIEALAAKIAEARSLRQLEQQEIRFMQHGTFVRIAKHAPRRPMGEVAPLIRRPVEIDMEGSYPELGIRSFGNGTFHKPVLSGFELGSKRVYWIEPGDLLFSNVFAWEGAIAVAKPEDRGRVGSHRFITCVPRKDVATSYFLRFYFLTDEGMDLIRAASPGGAGRNRTLGLAALDAIDVPVPPIEDQVWFDGLQAKVGALKNLQSEALVPRDLKVTLCRNVNRRQLLNAIAPKKSPLVHRNKTPALL